MKSKKKSKEMLESTIDLVEAIAPLIQDHEVEVQFMAFGSLISSILLSKFSTEAEAIKAYNFFLESVGTTVETVSGEGLSSWRTGTAH